MNDIPPHERAAGGGQPKLATIPGDAGGGGMQPAPAVPPASRGPVTGPSVGLAANLERTDRHPVLIFGSSSAGKSSFLISLVQSLRAIDHVDVAVGEPVLDKADPSWEAKHLQARDFFERSPYTLATGKPLGATQGEPFFLPMDITPRDRRLTPVKFAFLDSRGENYVPNPDTGGPMYKKLPAEIIEILENYSYGVTIIYIAPYSISNGHDRDTLESDFGLLGAISDYREHRHVRAHDSHLFLLTKWDQCAPPMDVVPRFDQVRGPDVAEVIADRYPNSWGDFCGIPLDGPAGYRRTFMQYTSGYFADGVPRRPPAKFADSFSRYPRTIINWLYANARQFRLSGDEASLRVRPILFGDVDDGVRAKRSIVDRIVAMLTTG